MAHESKMPGRQPSPVFNTLRSLTPAYVSLFLFSFFTPFLYLSGPIFGEQISDRVVLSRNLTSLWVLAGVAFFLVGVYSLLDFLRGKALRRLGVVIDQRLARLGFDALQREGANPRGSASSVILADVNTVRDFLSGPIIGATFDAIWSPLFIAVMFVIHPVFGYLTLAMIALTACLTVANQYLVRADSQNHQVSALKASEFGLSVTRSADTLRILGMIPVLTGRWYGLHQTALGWEAAATRRADRIGAVIKFFRNAQMPIVYTTGTLLYLANELGMATAFISVMIMMRATGPIDAVIGNWRQFANFAAARRRLDELLVASSLATAKISLPAPRGALTVSRLFATAPGADKVLLNDVTFSVGQGRVLGVVGPSGAGKSCLARILVGIWRPVRGTIALGDHELAHWNEDELGPHLGYMPQDVELLPGTLAENIARFQLNGTEGSEELIAAADLAGIQDLIKALPDGYNTVVGPGKHVLSGGQRQRVALARAVYGSPRFVVLDEPNSNLDAAGEQALSATVLRLKEMGTTVVLVTHKMNLLSCCDEVLVLNAGTVQAFGSRDQIVNRVPRLRSAPQLTLVDGQGDKRAS
ncbi:type I secretion system permease/ATPase [Methylobacterium sp. V23]|uniref:type I secretion system permease/ATPase n=1 Tax=Methylobacterium sp. V23 TaxID=2044878 RepID=UPI000CDB514E|nr:type I secretion system permease/ATPase [Methylobacterium sp. V23]POR40174.1 type I secretion system permease/ATPase [Methylobacterium sp. V23]